MAGVAVALKYEAITPTARMMHIRMTPALFADLQVMEAAALEVMAAQHKT